MSTNLQDLKVSDLKIICTGARYSSLPDGSRQEGEIAFHTDEKITACPLTWKSTKIKKVVKSKLASKTLSLIEGCYMSLFIAKLIPEIVYNDGNAT